MASNHQRFHSNTTPNLLSTQLKNHTIGQKPSLNYNRSNSSSSKQTDRRFSILPDPSTKPTGKFLISTSSELRIYQAWKSNSDQSRSQNQTSTGDELPYSSRCSDWTTTHLGFDLIATGAVNGHVTLTNIFRPHLHPSQRSQSPAYSSVSFPVARNSRSCLSTAFSPSGLVLAIGLDKTRDYGLQVYDVERILGLPSNLSNPRPRPDSNSSMTSIQSAVGSASLGTVRSKKPFAIKDLVIPSINLGNLDTELDQTPLAQALGSEAVNALEFMTPTSGSGHSVLLSASTTKAIKLYDIRSLGIRTGYHQNISSSPLTSPDNDLITQVLSPVSQWPVRSVLGIKADPLVPHRFASWGDDGCVRVWDTRKTSECLMLFSDEDKSQLNPHSTKRSSKDYIYSPGPTRSIVSLTWSKSRKGVLAASFSDSHRIKVWDIIQGIPHVQNSQNWPDDSLSTGHISRAGTPTPPASSTNMKFFNANPSSNLRKASITPRGSSPGKTFNEPLQNLNHTLFSSRLLKPFNLAPHSIATAHITNLDAASQRDNPIFVSVCRDGRLEFIEAKQPGEAIFSSCGQMVFSNRNRLRVEYFRTQGKTLLPSLACGPTSPALQSREACKNMSIEDIAELRLANKFGRHLFGNPENMDLGFIGHRVSEDPNPSSQAGYSVLRDEILSIMIRRAQSGYGPKPLTNQQLVMGDPSLCAFWEWIDYSEKLTVQGSSIINGYDFGFQGVLPIMRGFLPIDQQNKALAAVSNTAIKSQSDSRRYDQKGLSSYSPPEFFDLSRKLNKKAAALDTNSLQDSSHIKQLSEYVKAVLTFNHSHQVENFTINSELTHQRQTALYLCGPDYNSGSYEEIAVKYEQMGMYGKASAIALFSGNTQRAIASLQKSDDLQLRALAPTLATHLTNQRLGISKDGRFEQLCRQLADERTSEPFLRAIYAYCSTGDWHEVIDETGLPLRDRLAVALRFLDDDKIFPWLELVAKDAIQSGDLEGIVLTGLNVGLPFFIKEEALHQDSKNLRLPKIRSGSDGIDEIGAGFRLIQNHINRTGDLQTAALASHMVVPCRFEHPMALRWIESYRRLLDRWMMFDVRVKLDISRGQRSRQGPNLMSLGKMTHFRSKTDDYNEFVRPQIVIRCQHCFKAISDGNNVVHQLNQISLKTSKNNHDTNNYNFNGSGSNNENRNSYLNINTNSNLGKSLGSGFSNSIRPLNKCQSCGKSFPKCSICMVPLSINSSKESSIWAWCQKCRHVGHAKHFQQWRDRGNVVCPVYGCDCICWEEVGGQVY
ncbi:hypothetical protein BY996DRAFT_4602698 [Phakopsora pachyrhizi]|nr:hypothetical protein BY996DRAFT_4602698 [Phakopsora pachyrhizi]